MSRRALTASCSRHRASAVPNIDSIIHTNVRCVPHTGFPPGPCGRVLGFVCSCSVLVVSPGPPWTIIANLRREREQIGASTVGGEPFPWGSRGAATDAGRPIPAPKEMRYQLAREVSAQ